ncbi:hypothetical protein FKP32DRAFT_912851 [Trametes sanguinea]|nr:hypothetical protein FKP32DRAFT_912851 [Trametes sanguinea]
MQGRELVQMAAAKPNTARLRSTPLTLGGQNPMHLRLPQRYMVASGFRRSWRHVRMFSRRTQYRSRRYDCVPGAGRTNGRVRASERRCSAANNVSNPGFCACLARAHLSSDLPAAGSLADMHVYLKTEKALVTTHSQRDSIRTIVYTVPSCMWEFAATNRRLLPSAQTSLARVTMF